MQIFKAQYFCGVELTTTGYSNAKVRSSCSNHETFAPSNFHAILWYSEMSLLLATAVR